MENPFIILIKIFTRLHGEFKNVYKIIQKNEFKVQAIHDSVIGFLYDINFILGTHTGIFISLNLIPSWLNLSFQYMMNFIPIFWSLKRDYISTVYATLSNLNYFTLSSTRLKDSDMKIWQKRPCVTKNSVLMGNLNWNRDGSMMVISVSNLRVELNKVRFG